MPSPCLARWEILPLSFTDPIACLPLNGVDVFPLRSSPKSNFYCSRERPPPHTPGRGPVSLFTSGVALEGQKKFQMAAFPGDEHICVSLMRAVGLDAEERSCMLLCIKLSS
jgi:hypothetical protein